MNRGDARAGIHAWGFAVPRRRLTNEAVQEAWQRPGMPGARSVAAHDEDSLTLAVQAALQAIGHAAGDNSGDGGGGAAEIDGLLFATTTPPFAEKSSAVLLAQILGLPASARCIDVNGSLRAGTVALATAADLIAAGACRNVLVVAADRRLAAPGSADEFLFGHAGVALRVGPAEGAVAHILEQCERVCSQLDTWRTAHDRFPRAGDVRFARQGAYAAPMRAVLGELLERTGWRPDDIGKVVLYSPDVKSGSTLLKQSGFDLARHYCDLASPHLGLTGAAHTPLMLAAALEKAMRGEQLLALGYGDGASGFALEMVSDPPRAAFKAARQQGYTISYNHGLALHGLHVGAPEADGGFTSEIMEERNRELWFSLVAQRCTACQAVLTLPLPACPHCKRPTELEEFRLARTGQVFAITHEHYYPTPEPPLGMAIVDLTGGGRMTLQVADENVLLEIGDAVELVLRRLHDAGGRPNYFWKCRRADGKEG